MRLLLVCMLLLPTIVYSQSIGDCDAHYTNREDKVELQKSIDCYQDLLNREPQNFEAAWKLAKGYWYQGNHAPSDKAPYFEKGIDAGKKAAALDPKSCEGHFWLGVNDAMVAENSGFFKALGIVDDVKDEMHTAMDLQEDCECAGPQRVLGKLYERLPWFKGGSKTKSIEWLKKSLEICPVDTQSRLFLAETYLDQGKKDLAIEQLNLVLKQKAHSAWIPETKENKIKASEMLKKIQK